MATRGSSASTRPPRRRTESPTRASSPLGSSVSSPGVLEPGFCVGVGRCQRRSSSRALHVDIFGTPTAGGGCRAPGKGLFDCLGQVYGGIGGFGLWLIRNADVLRAGRPRWMRVTPRGCPTRPAATSSSWRASIRVDPVASTAAVNSFFDALSCASIRISSSPGPRRSGGECVRPGRGAARRRAAADTGRPTSAAVRRPGELSEVAV